MCKHKEFAANINVNRIEDIGRFVAEVRIHCVACKVEFCFDGIRAGFNYNEPTVSLDGLEASLPIYPKGNKPNPFQQLMGYTIKGTN